MNSISRCELDQHPLLARNADRNDAIGRRRMKLRAAAERDASASFADDDQRPGGKSLSPRGDLQRGLMRPTCVDSHHMEHPRHMAGAGQPIRSSDVSP